MANNSDQDLLLLFQRPLEPLFTKKDNGHTAFDVPQDYYTDRYKPIGTELQTRFGEDVDRRVTLRPVTAPDIGFVSPIQRNGTFSLFNQRDRQIAGRLTKIFMNQPDSQSFLSTAAFIKDRINPYLFQYALSVAVQHRPDTNNLNVPSVVQTFPEQFVNSSVFPRAREEGSLVPQEDRMLVDIPLNFTASDREIEQRLAYFREDIGVNMHHWHWHLVYPGEGEDQIVNKNRRGELFYYMHSQVIARYNVERVANHLNRVRPLSNFREAIIEGYFPKIIRSSNNRSYPFRVTNTVLSDVNRPDDETVVQVSDLERWRDRIYQAIDQGFAVDTNGRQVPLDAVRGIDVLGNMIEPSQLTPNEQFYGSLHNMGHNIIAYSHDPDARYLEDYGVMGDVTTAMRDPIFYRWHSFIDSIFQRHKSNLPEYDLGRELSYNGITLNSINVQITKGRNPAPNILLTYWQRSDVDLAAGLDFGPEGNVYAQFTHLQHAPFQYIIDVANNSGGQRRGTCRIFMTPRYDELDMDLPFRDQRSLMIEMDRFVVNLNPGQNTIRRRSDESSVTIPYERSFRRIGSQFQPTGAAELAQFQFCGCGWPQHMLLPKGSSSGAQFYLFAMISNYDDDAVNQQIDPNVPCNDAPIFCGLKDSLYPDRRAMGFPFDRPNSNVGSIRDFANLTSNMVLNECSIRFTNTIISRS